MHTHPFTYVGPNYVEAFPLHIAERVFRHIDRWVASKSITSAGQISAAAASSSISAAQTISSCTCSCSACRKLRMSAPAASHGRALLFEMLDRELERRISQYPWQPSWWCVILRDFSTFRARFDTPKS
ncbi:hypothetical protein MGG_16018 [Pyricularia oryzae 70-15]|uniref:Uncharacterized protein n=1 Tax=Pyricularia oryzae (strain 70-15 / ATCC MYA-4617 / FGSC 8958) TaxID=242507 RepID=G4MN74_PYRO7|nr:uncharacterized protein MGG_16018 [Pyricularia oryzae 70-15]EHA56197.1 hypothetical protein MGG_16018 [Pyricularia oryzae 70-15]